MTIKRFHTYEESIFKKPAMTIDDTVKQETILQIMQDLYDTHFQNPEKVGVGLAANQIGYPYRIFLAYISNEAAKKRGADPLPVSFWMNPTYESIGNETNFAPEGCFSVPEKFGREVKRFNAIQVRTQEIKFRIDEHDRLSLTDIENPKLFKLSGYQARLFQHEIDHIDPVRPKFYFEYMEGGIAALEPIENYYTAIEEKKEANKWISEGEKSEADNPSLDEETTSFRP